MTVLHATGRAETIVSEAQCVNCVFWCENRETCRRRAPASDVLCDDGELYPVFPSTASTEWCGEYSPDEYHFFLNEKTRAVMSVDCDA